MDSDTQSLSQTALKEIDHGDTSTSTPELTPMTLQPPVTTHLDSPPSNTTTASSANCATVSAPQSTPEVSDTVIQLRPASPLGRGFAEKWIDLPAELKLEIIYYAIRGRGMVHNRKIGSNSGFRVVLEERLFPFLRIGGEIADIAKEQFYKCHWFHIEASYHTWFPQPVGRLPHVRPYFAYPPRTVNHFIRKLSIGVKLRPREWQYIRKLADGEYGFANLRKMRILVNMLHPCFVGRRKTHSWVEFFDEVFADEIVFSAVGSLRFEKTHLHTRFMKYGLNIDMVEKQIREKVRFAPETGD